MIECCPASSPSLPDIFYGEKVKRLLLVCLLVVGLLTSAPLTLRAQRQADKTAPTVTAGEFGNVEAITAAQMKDWLYFVAADEMEGRNTPSRGLDLTAKFIALNLSRWGFKPVAADGSFFQKMQLRARQLAPETTSATVNGQSFKVGEDFLVAGASGTPRVNPGAINGQLVYVGHGRMLKAKNINPYAGLDVRDKIMLVADAYPPDTKEQDFRRGRAGEDYDTPETYARRNGARGIIYLPSQSTVQFWEQRYKSSLNMSAPRPDNPQMPGLPTITASEKMAAALLQGEQLDLAAIKKQMGDATLGAGFALTPAKQVSFTIGAKEDAPMTQNVVAVWEGSDPVLKNEYVAIGAHYDHVGVRTSGQGDNIFNGADDDGSGTVAMMAMAEALTKSERPKRSLLFVWHAGEEKGLLGSAFFAENPLVPLNQIVAQLNIDMIGRSKQAGDSNNQNANLTGPNEIYVIGSKMMSTELGALSEAVNKAFLNLTFNYKSDDPNDRERLFFRSDHYNYAKKGIPIIFYFDGVHEDYHGVGDHPEKIDYAKMEKVTRTVFATMWKLAQAAARPKVDKQLPGQLMGN